MGDAGRDRAMCLQAKHPRRCQPAQPPGERLGRALSLRGHQPADTLAWASPPPGHPITHARLPSAPALSSKATQGDGRSSYSFSILRATAWIRHLLSPDVTTAAQQVCLPRLPPPQPPASQVKHLAWPASSHPPPVGSTLTQTRAQARRLPPTAATQPRTCHLSRSLQWPQPF